MRQEMEQQEEKKTVDEELAELNDRILKITGGTFSVQPIVPTALYSTMSESLWNYYGMTAGFQRNQQRNDLVRGRVGWFVCQMSHGTQQIKLYEPWKYKNDINTPLRIRSRRIIQIASQEPKEKRRQKVKELYRTFPYHLLKNEPVNLRLKNFYFDRIVIEGRELLIYRADDPEHPNPESDTLITAVAYKPNRTVTFDFNEADEEHYYAVNSCNNTISNMLHFIWQEEIEFNVIDNKPPKKWVVAAEIVNGASNLIPEDLQNVTFKSAKYLEQQLGWKLGGEKEGSGKMKKLNYTDKRRLKLRRRKGHFYKEVQKMQEKYEILKLAGFFGEQKT